MIAAAVDPATARADARDILADRRFRSDPAPRPLRGVLRWIGDRLDPIGDALGAVYRALPAEVWVAVAVAVAASLVTLSVRGARRARGSRTGDVAVARSTDAAEDPETLEREAADAERRGELDAALRLRFRAGLLRLGARGRIEYRPSVTVREVRDRLGSATFEELAATFEEVAYGGRDAGVPDVDAARHGWPRVLAEARRR